VSAPETPAADSKGAILIVDDNPANLQLLTESLTRHGYAAYPACEGGLALEFVQSHIPDLILLDVIMPEPDGYEVCKSLKASERTRDIPVIFMTAMTRTEDKVTGFDLGAVDYITKPFQLDEVLARVRIHLALRAAQRQLGERNAQLQMEVAERKGAEEQVRLLNAGLEQRVEARTAELEATNARLRDEIEERETAEEALRRSESELRSFIGSAPYGIFRVNVAGDRLLGVNPAGLQMLGYPSESEALALRLSKDLYYTEDECRRFRDRLLPNARFNGIEIRWRRKDGKPVTARVSGRRIGDIVEGIAEDVTARRILEEQFYQAQKMEAVGRLAGGVAHDFNNLLGVIIGYSDMLLSEVDEPARVRVQEIQAAGRRAADLTRQLLAFSHRQVLQPRVLDLNAVVLDADRILRRLIGEDIRVILSLAPGVPPIYADPVQIEQIIMNLVVNARDAMPSGGQLTLETGSACFDPEHGDPGAERRHGSYTMLAVTDTGAGMSAETRARIFEPFFTTKEVGKGTGLGLATVYGIVNQSGGWITVESEPGKGATFRIYLPQVERKDAEPPSEADPQELLRGTETILLAEDADSLREMISKTLETRGYRVLAARDGAEAVKIAAAHDGPIHMLITDAIMPNMSGTELARNMAALRPDTKVLFMSGYTEDSTIRQVASQSGSFLQKPFRISELTQKMRQMLD
jgi:PAS domain S-box-containing protein